MKAFLIFVCFASTVFGGWFRSSANEIETPPATIKVLLKKHSDGALVEAKGPFEVVNPQDEKHLSSGWRGKRFFLYPHVSGIKWGEDFPGVYQLRIVPKSPETTFLVDGMQVKGCIEAYHIDGKVHIVNEVDIENFLKSVLTHHFVKHNLRSEVMDSLAIVLRTDAYYHATRSANAFWHLDAQTVGYNGCGLTLQNLNIDRSVDATRHLVMSFEGRPFPASFTEHCAGKTGSYRDIFRKNVPGPTGVKTPFAQKVRDESSWTFSVPKTRLAHLAKTNRVTDIDLFIDEVSNKTYGMRIKDGKHASNIDTTVLQETFGKNNIQSNDFTVTIKGDDVIFNGFGQGSGVGLCIYSAIQMAEKGELAPEILATFFPFTHLQQQRSLLPRASHYEEHHTLD